MSVSNWVKVHVTWQARFELPKSKTEDLGALLTPTRNKAPWHKAVRSCSFALRQGRSNNWALYRRHTPASIPVPHSCIFTPLQSSAPSNTPSRLVHQDFWNIFSTRKYVICKSVLSLSVILANTSSDGSTPRSVVVADTGLRYLHARTWTRRKAASEPLAYSLIITKVSNAGASLRATVPLATSVCSFTVQP